MTTLISAEIYKLKQTKFVTGLLIISAIFALFLILYTFNTQVLPHRSLRLLLREATAFASIIHGIFAGLFIGLCIASEFNRGLIRNAICLGKSRIFIYLSRLFSASLLIIIFLAIFIIPANIIYGLSEGFSNIIWIDMGMDFMLFFSHYLALAAIFTFFAFISKSPGATTAFSAIYILMLHLIHPVILGNEPAIFRFSPLYNIYHFISHIHSPDVSFIISGMAVNIGHIVVLTIIGVLVFIKSEIK